jgi:cytoskeletal protein CcmA (bactofilin family)
VNEPREPRTDRELRKDEAGPRQEGLIGPDLEVRGVVAGAADLRVEGSIEGTVSLEGSLTVAPDGSVTMASDADGPLKVMGVELAGELRGSVLAAGTVHIREGGRLVGDVRARRLAIDDGGSLEGAVEMDFDAGQDGGA